MLSEHTSKPIPLYSVGDILFYKNENRRKYILKPTTPQEELISKHRFCIEPFFWEAYLITKVGKISYSLNRIYSGHVTKGLDSYSLLDSNHSPDSLKVKKKTLVKPTTHTNMIFHPYERALDECWFYYGTCFKSFFSSKKSFNSFDFTTDEINQIERLITFFNHILSGSQNRFIEQTRLVATFLKDHNLFYPGMEYDLIYPGKLPTS